MIRGTAEQVPSRPVAIVFGARVSGDAPSDILADRLVAAVRLYRIGAVKMLLLSGDHGRREYDEVKVNMTRPAPTFLGQEST